MVDGTSWGCNEFMRYLFPGRELLISIDTRAQIATIADDGYFINSANSCDGLLYIYSRHGERNGYDV